MDTYPSQRAASQGKKLHPIDSFTEVTNGKDCVKLFSRQV